MLKSPLFIPFLSHVTPFDTLMLYFLEISVISNILTSGASLGIPCREMKPLHWQPTRQEMYCLRLKGLIRTGSGFPTKILHTFITPFTWYIASLTTIQIAYYKFVILRRYDRTCCIFT